MLCPSLAISPLFVASLFFKLSSFPLPPTILRSILLINKSSQHNVMTIFHKYSTWFHFLSIFLINHLYPYSFCLMTLFSLYILFHFISKVFHFSINLWKMMEIFSIPSCFLPNPHTKSLYLWVHSSSFVSGYQKGTCSFFFSF